MSKESRLFFAELLVTVEKPLINAEVRFFHKPVRTPNTFSAKETIFLNDIAHT
jgi:hypothetical protein